MICVVFLKLLTVAGNNEAISVCVCVSVSGKTHKTVQGILAHIGLPVLCFGRWCGGMVCLLAV